MTDGRAYRFETLGQLKRCLWMRLPSSRRLAMERGERVYMIDEAPWFLVANGKDRFAWIGADGVLRRENGWPGPILGTAARLVWSDRHIWALASETLSLIDAVTLQRLDTITEHKAVDIAADGKGGVWVLTDGRLLRLGARDRVLAARPCPVPAHRIGVAGETLYLLDEVGKVLTALRPDGTTLSIALDQAAQGMRSSGDVVLLMGAWGFLAFDAAGDPVCRGEWETPPLVVCPFGSALFAVFAEGTEWWLRLFENALDDDGEVLVTPVLESETLAGNWLRAQLVAKLPDGATLSINQAATNDEALATLAQGILADDGLAHDDRLRKLHAILPWSDAPIVYTGSQDGIALAGEAFDAPLSAARGNFLWLEATVHRNEGTLRPEIASLVVEHDVAGLMDRLPAIYRTPTGDADGTLHRLVEILEATFRGFDEEIGTLGDRLDPVRTKECRLAWLVRLLGLPFDETLDTASRRRLLHAAPEILAGRGTRAGVRALLTAVLGNRPYRIIDRTEQFIPVTLGGARLPAFLAGPSARAVRLNARLTLGKTPLNRAQPCDARLSVSRGPELLVAVPTTSAELRRLGAALRQMIEALIPAGVRLDLRWTAFGRSSGGTMLGVVEDWPTITLGAGMAPGAARLGGSCEPRLRDGGSIANHRVA